MTDFLYCFLDVMLTSLKLCLLPPSLTQYGASVPHVHVAGGRPLYEVAQRCTLFVARAQPRRTIVRLHLHPQTGVVVIVRHLPSHPVIPFF